MKRLQVLINQRPTISRLVTRVSVEESVGVIPTVRRGDVRERFVVVKKILFPRVSSVIVFLMSRGMRVDVFKGSVDGDKAELTVGYNFRT
jgi:hypothetical protein